MSERRPRVLLIAEAANPEWVSVPLVGWSHARALAELADVHVVTHVRNRDALLRAGWREGREFTAIDSEALMGPLFRLGQRLTGGEGRGWTTLAAMSSLGYGYFEHLVWRRFGDRLRAGEFDLVHRLTPLSPAAPSPIAKRLGGIGVPFVLGPLNGGVPWPRQFQRERRREGEWLSYLRGLHKALPGYRATRRHAAAILVGSRTTLDQLPVGCRDRAIYLPENAIDPARFSPPAQRAVERPLRLVFVGRLVPCKCVDVALEAAADLVREGSARLEVLGDGPERPTLERIVAQRGLAAGVDLAGWIDHRQLSERLARSDVLVFPSVREFGGGAVLEAMAMGIAPVVVDYGGPAELVTPQTGFKVPLGTREELTRAFRQQLTPLAAEPAVVRAMGRRARARVQAQFTWATRASQVLEVYDWVLGRRSEKPDFGMPLPDPPWSDPLEG